MPVYLIIYQWLLTIDYVILVILPTAPEIIGYDELSLATDMWSIGVIAYILFVYTHTLL